MQTAKRNYFITYTIFTILIIIGSNNPCQAQGFSWPEEPQNLLVLEVKGRQLGRVMRGFASSLGVRCSYCHEGTGPDLSNYDFASDQKITKQKACNSPNNIAVNY